MTAIHQGFNGSFYMKSKSPFSLNGLNVDKTDLQGKYSIQPQDGVNNITAGNNDVKFGGKIICAANATIQVKAERWGGPGWGGRGTTRQVSMYLDD